MDLWLSIISVDLRENLSMCVFNIRDGIFNCFERRGRKALLGCFDLLRLGVSSIKLVEREVLVNLLNLLLEGFLFLDDLW